MKEANNLLVKIEMENVYLVHEKQTALNEKKTNNAWIITQLLSFLFLL